MQHEDLSALAPIGGALALQDSRDGKPLLLVGGISLGGCGNTPTALLAWNETGDNTLPVALPNEDERVQAYYAQCAGAGGSGGEMPAECQPADGWSLSLRDFLDRYWGEERERYVAAVLALNYPALAELRRQPTPPHWTRDAILAVPAATLPPADKRARTAWLLRDARLAEALDYDSTRTLLPWLPAEDWTPVLRALAGKDELLQLLLDESERAHHDGATCRLRRALGHSCRG